MRVTLFHWLIATALCAAPLHGQVAPILKLDGTWYGSLELELAFRIIFHIDAPNGVHRVTADFPDQGVAGVPMTDVRISTDSVHIGLPAADVAFAGRISTAGDSIVGFFAQGAQRLSLLLTRPTPAQLAELERPQEPRRPFPYESEAVRVDNAAGSVSLQGTLTRPAVGGRRPAIVLIAGAGPLDRNATVAGHRPFLVLADELTRRGFVVLRLDKRGVGRSSGNFASATIDDFASDARAAVSYLLRLAYVDTARVGLIGHSEGALVAAVVAAALPRVAFSVLLAPPAMRGDVLMIRRAALLFAARGVAEETIAKDAALRQSLFAAILEPGDSHAVRQRALAALTRSLASMTDADRKALGYGPAEWQNGAETFLAQIPWFRDWLARDPVPVYRDMHGDVLALYGDKDQQVPAALNASLMRVPLAARSGSRADVTILPGLNHQLQTAATGSPSEYGRIAETIAPAALRAIEEWLADRENAPRESVRTPRSLEHHRHVTASQTSRVVSREHARPHDRCLSLPPANS